jgi:hypothetical protein
MTSDRFQPEIAGFREQQLPEREDFTRRGQSVEVPAAVSPLQPSTETAMKRPEPATPEGGPTSSPSLPRMDRLAELVTVEATVLRQFRPGTLTAVVRPDPHSELRIELRLHRGQVEARASLEKGDSAAFEAGWGELQETLRAQGITLQPLVESHARTESQGNPATGTGLGSGSRQGRREAGAEERMAPMGFGTLADVLQPASGALGSKSTLATGGTRHLLESWA